MPLEDIFSETYDLVEFIEQHNKIVNDLDEDKRKDCIIHHNDSHKQMKTKCAQAYHHGAYHYPLIRKILGPQLEDLNTPLEINDVLNEAKSSTERVRKYYRNHPEKVSQYLKKTVKDRSARNRDRKAAVKKHGKSKMKNHDVHHPNGPHGGSWRLAKKDHGPDKKKKNEAMLPEGNNETIIQNFIEYASKRLRLKNTPEVKLMAHIDSGSNQPSLGGYNPVSKEIIIGTHGRLVADILRTLAHELVHKKQDECGKLNPNSGDTGSPEENQANSIAGILMRDYGKKNREIYTTSQLTENILVEAAPKAHLQHPYDDMDITIEDIKDVLHHALLGDFEGKASEKTDGQNMSFTIKDGKVLFARNTGHMKNNSEKAMTADDIKQFFSKHGEKVSHSFYQAAKDAEEAIKVLSPEEQLEYFGNGERYIFAEIINPDMPNTIPYGNHAIIFHYLQTIDPVSGNPTDKSKDLSDKLAQTLRVRQADTQSKYKLSGNNYLIFSDDNKEKYESSFKEYSSILDKFSNGNTSATLGEITSDILAKQLAADSTEWTPEEIKAIVRRVVYKDKSFGTKHIADSSKKEAFRQIADNADEILDRAIQPVKYAVLNAGADAVARTTNLLSASDSDATVRMKEKLIAAIKEIQASGDSAKLAKLEKNLKILHDIGLDKVSPSEGTVFYKNGKLYKLTGTFAPVNQIVGMTTYNKPETDATDPAQGDSTIPREMAQPTADSAAKIIGFDKIERSLVGSTYKPVMGDLDIATSIDDVKKTIGYTGTDKKEFYAKLKEYLAGKGIPATINTGFEQVSISVPIVDDKGVQQSGTTQVDFMIGNLPWMKRYLTNGDKSEHSSTYRNVLIATALRSTTEDTDDPTIKSKYQINTRHGLEKAFFKLSPSGKKDTIKKEFVSADPDDVAKLLFGKDATFEMIDTLEKLNEKIQGPDFIFKDKVKELYRSFKTDLDHLKKDIPTGLPDTSDAEMANRGNKPVAIYPGRFQPFHAGHMIAYQAMVDEFGKENVYVVASDTKDSTGKNPFSFDEKKNIMTSMFDIPEDHIVKVKSPYAPTELLGRFPDDTPVVFGVGKKDSEERLGSAYFDMYDPGAAMEGYKKHGYKWIAPEPKIQLGDDGISGTQLRKVLGNDRVTPEEKKKLFKLAFGKFDQNIFDMVVPASKKSLEDKAEFDRKAKEQDDKKQKNAQDKEELEKHLAGIDPKARVENPATKRSILVRSALSYDQDHPAYKAARDFIAQSKQQ